MRPYKCSKPDDDCNHMPNPAEIRAECLKIRRTWDKATRRKRAGALAVQHVDVTEGREVVRLGQLKPGDMG